MKRSSRNLSGAYKTEVRTMILHGPSHAKAESTSAGPAVATCVSQRNYSLLEMMRMAC